MAILQMVLNAVCSGLGDSIVKWFQNRQAREDAQTAATTQQALNARMEGEAIKLRVDQAMEDAHNDPKPNMSDWN